MEETQTNPHEESITPKNSSEEQTNKKLNEKKEKIINWLKNPLNFSLTAVLLFAFAIRLYYFIQIGNQPLWWDELCYGGLAKNFAYGFWNDSSLVIGESLIRPLLFPIFWAGLILLKIPESGIRFILEFVPSVLSVFFVYLVGKEVFSKKIGIIAAFIFSVLWIHIFYTVRLLTNIPAMLFLFSSIYIFILATKKDFNNKYFSISLILLSISTLMRYPNGLVFFVYFFILILGNQLYLNKIKFWVAGIIGIFPILLFFLINFVKQGNIFPALLGGNYLNAGEPITNPIAFHILNFFQVYLQNIFFIFFLIGAFIILAEILIAYNFLLKNRKLRNKLLIVLILIAIYSFFIFYLRDIEDRWLFPTTLPICLLVGFGIDYFYKFIKKYNKHFAILLVLIILFSGAYFQIKSADNLINSRKTTYLEMRQGFEWIKDNVPKDAVIAGAGIEPYSVYYAERQYIPINVSDTFKILDADYLIIHKFSANQAHLGSFINENQEQWQMTHAIFFDAQQTLPAFVVYRRIQSLSSPPESPLISSSISANSSLSDSNSPT